MGQGVEKIFGFLGVRARNDRFVRAGEGRYAEGAEDAEKMGWGAVLWPGRAKHDLGGSGNLLCPSGQSRAREEQGTRPWVFEGLLLYECDIRIRY